MSEARWHIFHRWLEWSDIIVTKDGMAVQVRKCAVCNRQQVRFA